MRKISFWECKPASSSVYLCHCAITALMMRCFRQWDYFVYVACFLELIFRLFTKRDGHFLIIACNTVYGLISLNNRLTTRSACGSSCPFLVAVTIPFSILTSFFEGSAAVCTLFEVAHFRPMNPAICSNWKFSGPSEVETTLMSVNYTFELG